MMASLVAACGVFAICVGVIVALGMAVRCLEPADWCPPVRFRSEASLADRRRHGRDRQRDTVAERGADRGPKGAGAVSEEPTPVRILPFVRKPVFRP
jgi:hypothetical protein